MDAWFGDVFLSFLFCMNKWLVFVDVPAQRTVPLHGSGYVMIQ